MNSIFKDFKEFLFKGNLLETAVAFVIGLAFVALVNNFVASFITPIVNSILGTGERKPQGSVHLRGTSYLQFGSFINAVIVFVAIAAAVYFVIVLPVARLRARGSTEAEPAAETELDLLRQIRDGLNRP